MIIKSVFYFGVLLISSFFIVKGATTPGLITIEWFGYHIQLNIIFAIGFVLIFMMLVQLMVQALTIAGILPSIIKYRKDNKTLKDGLISLTKASESISLGNSADAVKFAKKAQKALPSYPIFDDILNLKPTNKKNNDLTDLNLAKSKIDEFIINFDNDKALKITENILKSHPNSVWAKQTQYQIYLNMSEFEVALNILNQLYKLKAISKQQFNLEKCFINYEMAVFADDNLQSLKFAEKGLKQQPNFIHLIELSVDILVEQEQTDKALKLIMSSVPAFEHGLSSYDLFVDTIDNLTNEEQIKWLNKLAKSNKSLLGCQLAHAKALSLDEKFDEAIDYLLENEQDFKEMQFSLSSLYQLADKKDAAIESLINATDLTDTVETNLIKQYQAWKLNNFSDYIDEDNINIESVKSDSNLLLD